MSNGASQTTSHLAAIDHDLAAGPAPIPMTILTGFLGAGKTTLLNRILNGDHGLRVAVLVNDFGSVSIDAELVVGVQDDVVSLANGCICCSIRDDLVETVMGVIRRPEAPEYILLEASGVADPSGIAMTFVNPGLRERIRLDSLTCVLDAEQIFAHPEHPALMELKLRQIAFSDMLVLNKVSLAGEEQMKRVREWIDDRFNRLRIVESDYGDVPLEILLSVGRFDPARSELDLQALTRGTDHAHAFSTWSFETDRPLSLERLREVVRTLPGTIYRCKGIIHTSDAPDRPAVLQVVGRRVDLSMQDAWGDRPARTRIVVIGARGTLHRDSLRDRFEGCTRGSALLGSSPGSGSLASRHSCT